MEETLVARNEVFKGNIVNLRVDTVRLPNGHFATREIVEHRGAVAIVALDDHNNVLLVEQYRTPAGRVLVEIPAGTLEAGEEPLECAKRELCEETGFTADEFTPLLGFFTCPGFCTEYIHAYLARGLHSGQQATEEDENIQVRKVPLADAVEMVLAGEICDAKSIAGLLATATLPRSRSATSGGS